MPSTSPILILQHGALAPPGVLGEWLAARGLAAEGHLAWLDPVPEDPERYGVTVSLGSEQSTGAQDPAWIADELGLLRRAAEADVPMLGLCFGGQAVAVALG